MSTPSTEEKTASAMDTILAMGSRPDSQPNQQLRQISSAVGSSLNLGFIELSDCPISKRDEWGPAISDMTLSINNNELPLIRFENYLNMLQNVSIKDIIVTTGNEIKYGDNKLPLTSMTLDSLLLSMNLLNQNQLSPNNNAVTSNTQNNDNFVIVSSQACLLPFANEAPFFDIKFLNPYNFHYSNPKVLVIVASPDGTSTQLIIANEQTLRFNSYGKKGQFRNIFSNIKEANDKIDRNENRLIIIQVPLKVSSKNPNKTMKQASDSESVSEGGGSSSTGSSGGRWTDYLSFSSLNLWGASATDNDVTNPNNSESKYKRGNPNFIREIPCLKPRCKCGADLVQLVAQFCYGVSEENVTVSCDTCSESHSGNDVMWHCPSHKNKIHPDGFDVCNKCALTQCDFSTILDDIGYEIIREPTLPIRVTYQYYFPISSENPGRISHPLSSAILTKLLGFSSGSVPKSQIATKTMSPVGGGSGRQSPVTPVGSNRLPAPTQAAPTVQQTDNPFRSGLNVNRPNNIFNNGMNGSNGNINNNASNDNSNIIAEKVVNPFNSNLVRGKDDYDVIKKALNSLNIDNRNNVNYFKRFLFNRVCDSDLEYLTDNDLTILFDKLGPRMRFRRWLEKYKKDKRASEIRNELFNNNNSGSVDSNLEQYSTIISIFKKLQLPDWPVYAKNFIDNGVTDLMLPDITEKDLENLIPQVGAKMIFRKYLLQSRKNY